MVELILKYKIFVVHLFLGTVSYIKSKLDPHYIKFHHHWFPLLLTKLIHHHLIISMKILSQVFHNMISHKHVHHITLLHNLLS